MTPGYTRYAEGSVLIEIGETRVLCTASIDDRVPPFLRGQGKGWVTAEYSMLPRATETRTPRETGRNLVSGRTQEIQRLIGRSLRAVVEMNRLGERTVYLDCDVIQADGGTRTASITGSFVALMLALRKLYNNGKIAAPLPVKDYVAAVSVGIINGEPLLDLDYAEDSRAEVDMNIVRTGSGHFIEIQGTAESKPFTQAQMEQMTALATRGIDQLLDEQRSVARPAALSPEESLLYPASTQTIVYGRLFQALILARALDKLCWTGSGGSMKHKCLFLFTAILIFVITLTASAQTDKEFLDPAGKFKLTLTGDWRAVSYSDAVGRQKTEFVYRDRSEGLLKDIEGEHVGKLARRHGSTGRRESQDIQVRLRACGQRGFRRGRPCRDAAFVFYQRRLPPACQHLLLLERREPPSGCSASRASAGR